MLLRALAPFLPSVRAIVPQLGMSLTVTSEKAQRLLGWTARPNEESISDMVESFIRFGLLPGASARQLTLSATN